MLFNNIYLFNIDCKIYVNNQLPEVKWPLSNLHQIIQFTNLTSFTQRCTIKFLLANSQGANMKKTKTKTKTKQNKTE